MALLNTPLRALQAGRKARTNGYFLGDMPPMPEHLELDYINGWKLQNIIELSKDKTTGFLVNGIEHHDLCSEVRRKKNKRMALQLRKDSWQTIDTLVKRLKLKPENVVDIALEQLQPIAIELQTKETL